MHWWGGSSAQSEKQVDERNQRQAKRFIRNLPLQVEVDDGSEDDLYSDCNLSNSFLLNVDGEAGEAGGSEDSDGSNSAAAMAPDPVVFQDETGEDDADYYKKLGALKNRMFNAKEPDFWFVGIETSMKHQDGA